MVTCCFLEFLGMQPEELGEGELVDISEESGCDKKHEDVLEEVTSVKKKSTLRELTQIFQNIESTKDKMLGV